METSWRRNFYTGRRIGLDWAQALARIELMGIKKKRRAALADELWDMELAALMALADKAE